MSRGVRGLGHALQDKGVLVSGETLIDEIRSEAVFYALRNIVRGKFLEFKFDCAIGGDSGEQIAVNVGLRIGGAADVLRQAVTDHPRPPHTPSPNKLPLSHLPHHWILN